LSEGEQRALALAGFLTEVALTDGSGPIVVDDPVSSLDRDRSAQVADRLAEEAMQRQVVVFTHDIIFFNELCRVADTLGIEPVTPVSASKNSVPGGRA
jgi:wobble nucleotide-excising tRNase